MKSEDAKFFAAELALRRLTHQEIADFLGTTRTNITNYCNGRVREPRGEFAIALDKLIRKWRKEAQSGQRAGAGQILSFPGGPDDSSPYVRRDHTCPQCKSEVPGPRQGAAYCCRCAAPLNALECPKCSHLTPFPNNFCNNCGTSLKKAQTLPT